MNTNYRNSIESSIQKLDRWVEELDHELGWIDTDRSFRLLRVTLHALRDSLQTDEVAQLAAQLPLVMKAFFYEGWNPGHTRSTQRADFVDTVFECFLDDELSEVEPAITCVFTVINGKISEGEIEDVRSSLHHSMRDLWPIPRERVFE